MASINPRAVRGATVTGLPPQLWMHYRDAKGLPGSGLAAVFQASLAYRPAVSGLLPGCKGCVKWCTRTLTLRIPKPTAPCHASVRVWTEPRPWTWTSARSPRSRRGLMMRPQAEDRQRAGGQWRTAGWPPRGMTIAAVAAPYGRTLMVPSMLGWTRHSYVYVPGLVNVRRYVGGALELCGARSNRIPEFTKPVPL